MLKRFNKFIGNVIAYLLIGCIVAIAIILLLFLIKGIMIVGGSLT